MSQMKTYKGLNIILVEPGTQVMGKKSVEFEEVTEDNAIIVGTNLYCTQKMVTRLEEAKEKDSRE